MSADIEKHYISADDQQKASFDLAWNIVKSGFRPDYIVGVWRGGTPVGITVQEVLEYNGATGTFLDVFATGAVDDSLIFMAFRPK